MFNFEESMESEPFRETPAMQIFVKFQKTLRECNQALRDAVLDELEIAEAIFMMEGLQAQWTGYDPVAALPFNHPIRKFVRLAVDGSDSPQPELALGAAITLFGTAAGRIYMGPTDGRTNVYVMGLAGSSAGKDRPMRAAMEILNEGAPELLGGSGVKSGRALISLLESKPVAALFIDEGGEVFGEAASENAPQHVRDIASGFTSLYSASQGLYAGDNYANQSEKPKIPLYNPCLSLFSVSNPVSYFSGLTERAVVNGSLARYLLIEAKNDHPNRNRKTPDASLKGELVDLVHEMRNGTHYLQEPEVSESDMKTASVSMDEVASKGINLAIARISPSKAEYSDDVAKRFGDMLNHYQRHEKRKFKPQGFSAIVGRTRETTMKLATIAAVVENPKKPRVTLDNLIWGNFIARTSTARLIKASTSDISDSPEGRLRNKIEQFITEAGADGAPKSAITKHAKNCKGGTKAIDEALKMMATMETFAAQPERPNGRKTDVWYAVEFLAAAKVKRIQD